MKTNTDKATPTPWRKVTRSPDCMIAFGLEHPVKPSAVEIVADFHTPSNADSRGFVIGEKLEANIDLIVRAVNEYAALNAVAQHCEKLRLTINALLCELPNKSVVNGEDNFPFRLRVLKIQAAAEQSQSNLESLRKG